MAQQKHIIKRQLIELEIQNTKEVHRLQNEVSRVYRQRVIPLIDQYCTELSQADRIHRIETLELNLGALDPTRLEADFVTKLSTELRRALAKQIGQQEQSRQSPKETSQLELFAFFVRTGSLPWWADTSQPQLPESGLQHLLESAPDSLRGLLRQLVQEPRPRQRIVAYFADELLAQVLALLAPSLKPVLEPEPEELIAVLQKTKALAGRQPAQLRQLTWATLLQVAALTGGQTTLPGPFYQAVLARVAADLGLAYRALMAAIQRVLRADAERTGSRLRQTLTGLIEDLPSPADHRTTEAVDISPGAAEVVTSEDIIQHLARLQQVGGPLAGLWGALRLLVPRLSASTRRDLLAILREMSSDGSETMRSEVMRRLLQFLPPALAQQSLTPVVRRELRAALPHLAAAAGSDKTMTELVQILGEAVDRQTENRAGSDGDRLPDLSFSDADEIYIGNAGLVILWPFLGHFFTRLNLLTDNQFTGPSARQRAVGLLQYLAVAEPSLPEYLLPLNKVLCGLELAEVFDFGPPVSETETEECTNILGAVIANAPILRDMSAAGFRGTFLLRQGVLSARDGAWLLRVERETYDVVLDRFPWGWEWVKLPWMEAPLRVEW